MATPGIEHQLLLMLVPLTQKCVGGISFLFIFIFYLYFYFYLY